MEGGLYGQRPMREAIARLHCTVPA